MTRVRYSVEFKITKEIYNSLENAKRYFSIKKQDTIEDSEFSIFYKTKRREITDLIKLSNQVLRVTYDLFLAAKTVDNRNISGKISLGVFSSDLSTNIVIPNN